ncbi:MAG: hypothetical protein IPK93_11625 [Solirubrobacterales bacterium]|nr:hypothetical protein [Solirubrobacterales bacterium]
MPRITNSIAVVIAVAVGMLGISVSQAAAAGETVTSFASIKPRVPLSKTERRPVDVHLEGKVKPGAGQLKLRELTNVKLNLPKDLTFSTKGTPVCTNDIGQIDPENANRPTASVIADCPKSLVGEGTAIINIAGSVAAEIKDPQLVIFNGGTDSNGNPKLLIHGYSATVIPGGFGIIMQGTLLDGVLDVAVPKLAADSAVTEFKFDLPGKQGKDPAYAQASCSTGLYRFSGVFTLADSDPNSGTYINKSALTTNTTTQKCVGSDSGSGGGSKSTWLRRRSPDPNRSRWARKGPSKSRSRMPAAQLSRA